jgi:hypothetical protein
MFCVFVTIMLVAFVAVMDLPGSPNRNNVEWLAINLDVCRLFE